MNKTDELRTTRIDSLVTPAELARLHPVSAEVKKFSMVKTNVFW